MKKIAFIFSIFVYGIVLGQVPQKLSYQAVIRDASNNIVSNQPVGIRISIIQGSPTGTPVYIETHNPMTNTDGLVSIEIAGGVVVSGTFSVIDWSKTPYFLFTEVDPTGGVSYSIFSTTELMSVPYALFAEKSRNPGPAGPQGVQGSAGVNGANGVGINNAQVINDSLKLTLTNGNAINAGYVKGTKGDTGIQGPAGVNGANGVGINNAQVINDSLKLTLTNGNMINAGYVKGTKGDTGIQGPKGDAGISVTNTQVLNDSLKVTLSNGTIINTGYVKGTKGDTGYIYMIGSEYENSGINCQNGGVRLTYGLDLNRNKKLDSIEIDTSMTNYICNGQVTNPIGLGNHGQIDFFSGLNQNWTVPQGVTLMQIIIFSSIGGSSGQTCVNASSCPWPWTSGGGGNYVGASFLFNSVPGQILTFNVGQNGISGVNSTSTCFPGTSGTDGTDTYINVNGIELIRCSGGKGGVGIASGCSQAPIGNGTTGVNGLLIYNISNGILNLQSTIGGILNNISGPNRIRLIY